MEVIASLQTLCQIYSTERKYVPPLPPHMVSCLDIVKFYDNATAAI